MSPLGFVTHVAIAITAQTFLMPSTKLPLASEPQRERKKSRWRICPEERQSRHGPNQIDKRRSHPARVGSVGDDSGIHTHISSTALIRRMRYRHGVSLITPALLAVVTIAWRQVHSGIWGFALMALVSTAFTLGFALSSLRSRSRLRSFSISPGYFICVLPCWTSRSASSAKWAVRVPCGSLRFRFLSSGSLRCCLIAMNETPNRARCTGLFAAPVFGSLPECVAKGR
jgi:hypothetical protein